MHARPMIVLYDAIVTIAPVEERFLVKELHQQAMCDKNTWVNHGRTWSFPIDTSFSYAWSAEPSKDKQEQLDDPTWVSDPTKLTPCEALG